MTVTELVTTYGKKVRSKRDGWLMCCLYPDHRDSTPSFSVRQDGVFFCWGCSKGGNFATLLHDIAGYSWKRAISHADLTATCVPMPTLTLPQWDTQTVSPAISKGLLGLYTVDWASGYARYRTALADGDQRFPPWCFPFRKGFTPVTLQHFQAGYDSSYKRVTIPVYNLRRDLVGFVGRTCIGDEQKYMVYPPLLPSEHVYGLHRAVRARDVVVLVEGPWDVWHLWELDPAVTAVALMTTHVTAAQIARLATVRKSYVLLFDADKPGRKGSYAVASALLDHGCRIDIAVSPKTDIKTLTRQELADALEKRKPFPALSAMTLLGR